MLQQEPVLAVHFNEGGKGSLASHGVLLEDGGYGHGEVQAPAAS